MRKLKYRENGKLRLKLYINGFINVVFIIEESWKHYFF